VDKLKPAATVAKGTAKTEGATNTTAYVVQKTIVAQPTQLTNEVRLVGVVKDSSGYARAFLSDGSSYGPSQGLEYLDGNQALINGKVYKSK